MGKGLCGILQFISYSIALGMTVLVWMDCHEICTILHGPQMMNPRDFDDPLTFHVTPPASQNFQTFPLTPPCG